MPSDAAPVFTHIIIGTPCYGGNVTQHYMISAIKLKDAARERGIAVSFNLLGGDALITRARNIVTAQFLAEETATHLLFIDADIGYEPEQVFALLEADKDVVGAAYPVKRMDWELIERAAKAGVPNLSSGILNYVVEFLEPDQIQAVKGFARCRYLGNGFLMIKRRVFPRMAAHYPETQFKGLQLTRNFELSEDSRFAYFDCIIDPETGAYLSEDYTFCKRWVDMGGEIWVDLNSKLTHVGPFSFHGNLMSTFDQVGTP
jgi:hypothetical protein